MTQVGRQQREVLASVERRTLDALAGIDGLLDPSGGTPYSDGPRSGLRMIVAERQVRELARQSQQEILGLLSEGGLRPEELTLAATLLHTSQIVGQMCDEYVDLHLLGAAEIPAGDDHVTSTLSAMRTLTRRQVRAAAETFSTPREELTDALDRTDREIDNRYREIIERALVGEDGAVRHEALGCAVIAAECMTRISEHAVNIGDSATRLTNLPPRAERQSPV